MARVQVAGEQARVLAQARIAVEMCADEPVARSVRARCRQSAVVLCRLRILLRDRKEATPLHADDQALCQADAPSSQATSPGLLPERLARR